MTSTASEPTRREVAGYQIIAMLGEGGMGVVYLARQPGGERVALKVLRPHIVGGEEARARLAREVSSLSRVRSARVAEILDADPWGEIPFVVTRYVPGLPLHDHVRDEGPATGRDLTWFAYGLADALAAVHRVGVVHRDVKPSNVLMEGRSPVLIDFGLARVAEDARLTQVGAVLGTPGYLAPELIDGDDATVASDVHCWAATVAYAGTGRAPFGRGDPLAIMDRVRRGQQDLAGLPDGLCAALTAAMDPDPSKRPPLAVFLDWLGQELASPAGAGNPDGPEAGPAPVTMPLTVARKQNANGHTTPLTTGGHPVAQTRVLPPEGPAVPPFVAAPPAAVPAAPTAGVRAAPATPVQPPAAPGPPPGWTRAPVSLQRPPAWPPGPESRALRWRRRGVLLAVVAAAGAGVAAYPYVATLLLVVAAWLLRGASLAARSARERRRLRGSTWYDTPRALLASPWHLVAAIPGTLMLALWSGGLALAVALLCFAASVGPFVTLAASGAVLAGGLWWGPGSSRVRGPAESVLRRLCGRPVPWALALGCLLVLAWLLAMLATELGPTWTPASAGPIDTLTRALSPWW